MPAKVKESLFGALGQLGHRVLMKYDGDLENVPSNVMLKKWLPQQDILAHQKVKLFVTHGGLLSQMESVNWGVPMLVMPCLGDQPSNAARCERMGFGLTLNWPDVTRETLLSKMTLIMNDPKFGEKARRLGDIFRDSYPSPLEKAVYYVEYVIRHKGAPHLKSPVKQLHWFQYFLLDVLAFIIAVVAVLVFIVASVFRFIRKRFLGHNLDGILTILAAYFVYKLLFQ